MSLYITTDDGKEINVHIGSGPMREKVEPMFVDWIQADGDELTAIYRKFDKLPYCNERVVRWYGDTAKFIIGNL